MPTRTSWIVRAAVRCVPETWRAAVRRDLEDETGLGLWSDLRGAAQALGVAIALHWAFTRTAFTADVRYAIRSMAHARWFTAGAILTFAMGIGVNVAVFSAVDRMLFRTLPFDHPDRLVVMGEYRVGDTRPYGTLAAMYVERARQAPAVEDLTMADWNLESYRLTPEADGARYFSFVPVAYTTMRTLGVRPVIGADFTREDVAATPHRVLISYDMWRLEFGGRTDIVGRTLWGRSAGEQSEIAGVLPADFIPPQVTLQTLTWNGVSVSDEKLEGATPRDRSTPPIVRLKPGVPVTEAQAQIDTIVKSLAPLFPKRPDSPDTEVRLAPLREALFGRYQTYLVLVFAAATMVLLVGCANLASLLLIRGRSREHRAAVQLALGASRGRLLQTAVVEALLLAVSGCLLALVVLRLADSALAAWLPAAFSTYTTSVFTGRVLVFSTALAMASALVAGILPGWRSCRVDILSVLQRGTRRAGSGRLRGAGSLMAIELAVSTLLVACAVLTCRTFINLVGTDVGFESAGLSRVTAYLPRSSDSSALLARYHDMLDVLRHTPGVASAAGADLLPISGAVNMPMFAGDDRGQRWAVTDSYIETMKMRVIAGRPFGAADVTAGAPVGMLSESGLTRVWPGVAAADAVGRFLEFPNEAPRQVVAIVSDIRYPYDGKVWPSLYVPIGPAGLRGMEFVARMDGAAVLNQADLARRFEQRGLLPRQITGGPVTASYAARVVDQKFRAELFAGFGVVAVVLAVIGLYAVQSFAVALRRSEFGIRIALGAEPRDLWRLLIRETLGPAAAGVAAGLVLTYWAGQFLDAFLYHVPAHDPATYAAVAIALGIVSAVAVWAPARRAAATDPATVLRAE